MSMKYCTKGDVVILQDAGHWLLHEEPRVTSRLMIDFFKGPVDRDIDTGRRRVADPSMRRP